VEIEWDKVSNKHTIACLLKQFVRELPQPLIPDANKYLEVAGEYYHLNVSLFSFVTLII
jgi:hypothetical protein